MEVDSVTPPNHGKSIDGGTACCRRVGKGVVDCTACLDEEWNVMGPTLDIEEMRLSQLMLFLIGQAGDGGVSKEDLIVGILRINHL